MKSLFVCSTRKINDHVGEYYDDIFEVPHQPISTDIAEYANEVRERIRQLWRQDVADESREGEPVIHVHLDGASPFNSMLIDFQIVMGKEEGIVMELPYLNATVPSTNDPETVEVMRKLDEREGVKNV